MSMIRNLIEESKEKEYINIYPTDIGFNITVDNGRLHALLIKQLQTGEDNDLFIWNWSKYSVGVFSCETFNKFCEETIGDNEKMIIPSELTRDSMVSYMFDCFKKFNSKGYDYEVKDGWIINRVVLEKNMERQNEIDNFVQKQIEGVY